MRGRSFGVLLLGLVTATVALIAGASPGMAAKPVHVDSMVTYVRGGAGCGVSGCVPDAHGDIHFGEVSGGPITGTFAGFFVENLAFVLHPDGTSDFTGTATCGFDACAVVGRLSIIDFVLKGTGRWNPSNFVLSLDGDWSARARSSTHASGARTASGPRTIDLPDIHGKGHFHRTDPGSEQYTGLLHLN